MAQKTRKKTKHSKRGRKRWSQRVTNESAALILEPGVFTLRTPRQVALSLKCSADSSLWRNSSPFRSAMSMLTFYINRGGKGLSAARKNTLEKAKHELRALYGKD